ncbi:MAG: DUF2723 domain-containing protein [Balneolaceae bacterium]|nr:DUF2723 domain-containing protein [Balneolaceae bacterium]
MFKDHRTTNKWLALFVFFASLLLYFFTMAPTASFWDAGEFIAVAHGLQVNHPPGAPFYSLLGRLFSMFMPSGYVAMSINFVSALTSALTVMLLYLIVVRLVREWKPEVDAMEAIDKMGMYGGALLGAFTFAVTDTFWFNAAEAEVYAISMFFTAAVVWMALKWSEHHREAHNERWLILIAYMFGLALGVHLLNLLAFFFVVLIVYFKKREFQFMTFLGAGLLSVLSFGVIYPFTIQTIPSIMDGIDQATYGLIGPIAFMVLVAALVGWALWYTHTRNHRLANLVVLAYTMILIGYSSYALIFIRSVADPPIDENDPETMEAFISYLEREQYGQTPLLTGYTYDNSQGRVNTEEETFLPRRYSQNPQHMQAYANYASDWDYFWSYQVNHMYIRYFNWNFIGRESDIQDTGWQAGFTESPYEDNPAHNSYFYLPFLIGLFGMIFHFQKDWKRALSVMVLFIMTGLAVIVFLNQTPDQPRERDYAYVGSYFAFAIWVGMGGVGLIQMVKEYLGRNLAAAGGVLGLCMLALPLWMGYQNFHDHDRSERYIASDYAYNLLNSVAPNGILFTNGDNDTFPLWYLQEVEGVRTDVRIVCLSLLNTDWYIKQLRDQWSHESAPLPIDLTNEEIEQMTSGYTRYQPDTLSIPVDKQLLRTAFSGDRSFKETIGVKPDTSLSLYREGVDFGIPVDSLDNEVSWYLQGRPAGTDQQGNEIRYLQIQDEMILHILRQNQWLRPVYFSNTVSSGSQLNLQDYFRFEGKAFRVVPQQREGSNYGWIDPEFHAKRLNDFRFRGWDNPDMYLDENIRRMLGNYRFSITELADRYRRLGNNESAVKWLDWGREKVPFLESNTGDFGTLALYAYSYAQAGDTEAALELVNKGQPEALDELSQVISRYDGVQSEYGALQEKINNARMNANMERQRRLKQQIQDLQSRFNNVQRDISRNLSHLMLMQRIYYLDGDTTLASQLADTVNDMTTSRVPFPTTEAENLEYLGQFGLD